MCWCVTSAIPAGGELQLSGPTFYHFVVLRKRFLRANAQGSNGKGVPRSVTGLVRSLLGLGLSVQFSELHPLKSLLLLRTAEDRAGALRRAFATRVFFTACDTGGQELGGYGVPPRTEYLEAIRRWNEGAWV